MKLFQFDGQLYQFMSKAYGLFKINLFFLLSCLLIVPLGPFVSSVSKVMARPEGVTSKEIVQNVMKDKGVIKYYFLQVLVFLGLVAIAFRTPANFLPLVLILLVIHTIVSLNILIGVDFSKKAEKEDFRLPLYITFRYLGFFCIVLLVYLLPPAITFFFPILLPLYCLTGFSLPFYIHHKIYHFLVKQLLETET